MTADDTMAEVEPDRMVMFTDQAPKHSTMSKEELFDATKAILRVKLADGNLLAENFQFKFPIIELDKKAFLAAFPSFGVDEAFPDMQNLYYGFRLDPTEVGRVWFDVQSSGTNTGQLKFGKTFEPTNKFVKLPPQTFSMTFDEDKLCTLLTGGYVVDRNVGNTGGLGGVFGLLYGIGQPLPFPEGKPRTLSWRFRFFSWLGQRRRKKQLAK